MASSDCGNLRLGRGGGDHARARPWARAVSRRGAAGYRRARTDCKECKSVHEKYQKIFFKKAKETFKQEHPEVARYEKAAAYLAKHPDDKDSTRKELQQEQAKLVSEITELKGPLTEVQEDLKKLRDIRYWVRKAAPAQTKHRQPNMEL